MDTKKLTELYKQNLLPLNFDLTEIKEFHKQKLFELPHVQEEVKYIGKEIIKSIMESPQHSYVYFKKIKFISSETVKYCELIGIKITEKYDCNEDKDAIDYDNMYIISW